MTTEASAVSDADTEGKQTAGTAEPQPENKQKSEAAAADPEGESSSPKAQEQASEPGPADVASSPEEEQLKPRTRTSAGKGLSKLFSSFLKRRSQCSEGEGFEVEKAKEDKEDKEEKAGKVEVEKEAEVKSEEKETKTPEPKAEAKAEAKELKKKEEKVEPKEQKKKDEEKKGSKKKKKEVKKKIEETVKKDDVKVKKEDDKVKKEDDKVKKEDDKVKKEDDKAKKEDEKVKPEEEKEKAEEETTVEKEETSEPKAEVKEEAATKDEGKQEDRKEVKEEVKIDKKEAKKKEKEKKKEEEKAKKKEEEKAREAEKAKKKEQEKLKKKEEEKAKEAKKKEVKAKEEKTKKTEEETKKKEEETKKKEEETKKKEEETKKKEEETKKKEEEIKKKEEETKKKEEEKAKEVKKEDEVKKKPTEESVKKEELPKEETKKLVKEEQKTDNKPKKEEEKGKRKDKGKRGKKDGKQSTVEKVKAPIAAPEPELKTEPDIEQAPDQHSVSSAEAQQGEHKEDPEVRKEPEVAEEVKEEDAKQKEAPSKDDDKKSKKEKKSKSEGTKSAKDKKTEEAKGSKQQKTMQCKVTLLDDALFECELDKHAKGQELFTKVCDHLNLMEKDYFGLAHWESPSSKTWIDPAKELRKQATGGVYDFTFNVKFYPPDPAQLTEDLTRYCLCLQLRKDIMRGVLPCSFVTLSLLGSYTAQSELGEYDPELHGVDYVKDLNLAPGQSKELEEKVMELHRTYRSMSPAQADMLFLENAKKLAMYGVDLHQAKDLEGVDITLGVCSSGLMVYKDKLRINRFPWPKVLKISYKRSSFFIKIRASEQEQYESTIGFKLPNYKASKKLWKVCVEHHTFFRVSTVEPPSSRRFLVLGSKFRYSGRTQTQTRQASSMIDRPAPRFTRSASKRLSRNLDGVPTQRGARPVSAPVFSQAALAEAGIPMAPLDQPQTSTPIKGSRQDERRLEVTIEDTKMEAVAEVKEFDKPHEDLLRHHASISELKRTFMESVPESRPSEWDKRLSTHSPLRTLGINGQPLPNADGPPLVQTQTVTITAESSSSLSSGISTTEVPIVPTQSVTYESSKVTVDGADEDKDGSSASSSKTVTMETTSGTTITTTTTHISKVVKSGSSETRVEKRIVITADSEFEQEKGKDAGASAL